MTTAAEFIRFQRAEIGTVESPAGSNCNPYSHELGRPCERWCCDEQVCMARRHNVGLPSDSASTPVMAAAFQRAGRWHTTPELGDFVFYGHNPIHHVGCVSQIIDADIFYDIGGNTAHDSSHVNPNGGGVWENRRSIRGDDVNGFGRPAFADDQPAPQPPMEDDDMPWIANPVTDSDPGEYFVNGNTYTPIATPDEAQQLANSGFHVHDLEPHAWSLFKATATEVPHP